MANITLVAHNDLSGEEWDNKFWKISNLPFHEKKIHRAIATYYDLLFKEGEKGRVFVPLCGKTVDMIYFADKGHEVVGVEFSEIGVEDFFKENNLAYEKTEKNPFMVYKAKEKNITIFRGDFFDLKKELVGEFDALWDRGGLTSVSMAQRLMYADLSVSWMKKNSKYLLNVFNYNPTRFSGPPHYVTRDSLKETFGRHCTIQFLGSLTYAAPERINKYVDELIQDDYLLMLK